MTKKKKTVECEPVSHLHYSLHVEHWPRVTYIGYSPNSESENPWSLHFEDGTNSKRIVFKTYEELSHELESISLRGIIHTHIKMVDVLALLKANKRNID
jgi:hypothetical protein